MKPSWGRLIFGFGSVFSGLRSVRFGFFSFRLIKPKPNQTGRFFQNFNRFFSWFSFFSYFFPGFFSLISFLVFFLIPNYLIKRAFG